MSKLLRFTLLFSIILYTSAETGEFNLSAEQLRELGIDDLIKSLEERINANKLVGRDTKDAIANLPDSQDETPSESDSQAESIVPKDDNPVRMAKRKIYDEYDGMDELKKEAYGIQQDQPMLPNSPVLRNKLNEFDRDEQYYRSLMRLQNLYRMYNKRYLDSDFETDKRSSRHCGGDLVSKKMSRIQTSRMRYLEKSRVLADKIADAAMNLVSKKSCILDRLCSGCGCRGRQNQLVDLEPAIVVASPIVGEAQPVVVIEEASKRDVDIATASSSATSLDSSVNVGGVSIDKSIDTSVASASHLSADAGGVDAGISTASGTSSDLQVDGPLGSTHLSTGISTSSQLSIGAGTNRGLGLGLGSGLGAGFYNQLSSCEDYERKMVMDLAIEDAAEMIQKLAYETGNVGYREDPGFERRVLSLAIDLVNKVTFGIAGDATGNLDLLQGFRYNNVDDYLRATIADGEMETDLISNAGFDYAGVGRPDSLDGRRLYDGMDIYDDYVGHASPYSRGRCDSCSRYDLRLGNMCPLCKRSGHMFQGRSKRSGSVDKGRVHHLEQLPEVQSKVNIQ